MSRRAETHPAELFIAVTSIKTGGLEAARLHDGALAAAPSGLFLHRVEKAPPIGQSPQMLRKKEHVEEQNAKLCPAPKPSENIP